MISEYGRLPILVLFDRQIVWPAVVSKCAGNCCPKSDTEKPDAPCRILSPNERDSNGFDEQLPHPIS